jgi:hypothetical protein
MKSVRLCCGVLALLAGGATLAHHSFAMFDRDKRVTIVGTVHEFQWTNPHAWIEVDVPNEKGGQDKWGIELNSPNNLARQGWKSTMLKRGDKVTVVLAPLKSGDKGGLFVSVILPNGKVMGDRMGPQPAEASSKPAP